MKNGLGRGLSRLLEQSNRDGSISDIGKRMALGEKERRNTAIKNTKAERDEYWNNKMWEFGQFHNEEIKEKELIIHKATVDNTINDMRNKALNDEIIKRDEIIKKLKYKIKYREDIISMLKIKKQTKIRTRKTNKNKQTYLLKDCSLKNRYKIGYSANPKQREKTLQAEKPTYKIIKLWDKNIERQLHREYAEYRGIGEWFTLNKIQITYMCTHY